MCARSSARAVAGRFLLARPRVSEVSITPPNTPRGFSMDCGGMAAAVKESRRGILPRSLITQAARHKPQAKQSRHPCRIPPSSAARGIDTARKRLEASSTLTAASLLVPKVYLGMYLFAKFNRLGGLCFAIFS